MNNRKLISDNETFVKGKKQLVVQLSFRGNGVLYSKLEGGKLKLPSRLGHQRGHLRFTLELVREIRKFG